jgi:two-component system NtrC family sensor kinase
VKVSDTGCGIPEENLNKIFDPFFTTKTDKKGTGLGLAVSYGIIDRHRGRIEVQSEVGRGTIFTIQLPLEASEEVPST